MVGKSDTMGRTPRLDHETSLDPCKTPVDRPRTLFSRLAKAMAKRDWSTATALLARLSQRQALARQYLFAGGRRRDHR